METTSTFSTLIKGIGVKGRVWQSKKRKKKMANAKKKGKKGKK